MTPLCIIKMECARSYACFSAHESIDEAPKVDANVIEINLACLRSNVAFATGDPYFCKSCESLFNSRSVLTRSDAISIWICEFCGHSNELNIEDDELPKYLELTYLLEGAVQSRGEEEGHPDNLIDATAVIFCIDTSGSMAISSSGVSRLKCMQTAVESQIQHFLGNSPAKKVGILTFDSKVRVLGDGTIQEIIPSASSNQFDKIMEFAQSKRGVFINRCIAESAPRLSEKINGLRAVGGTALGPALLASVIFASEGGRGSKVIICTDGLANEGIGSLEGNSDQTGFYKEVASIAKELGVCVSLISIVGTECRLESLALVTEETGGSIVKVAPESLSREFANVMSDDVIATQVTVQVSIHKAIKFAGESPEHLTNNGSKMNRSIGNATPSSAFSFRYELRSNEEINALGINKLEITSLPFQALFRYYTLDGRKCMRAITKVQPVTFDREVASEVDIDMLARAGRRKAVQLAEEGKLEEAKKNADMWKGLLKEEAKDDVKNAAVLDFDNDVLELEENIDKHLMKEEGLGINIDELPEEEKVKRRKNYGDDFIVGMSKMKKKR